MKPVFADTGFWIALLYPKDRFHQEAIELYRSLQKQKRKVVTSDLVLTEFLNFFSSFDANLRQKAGLMVKKTQSYTNILVLPQSKELFQQALELYLQRADKAWSLTDCSSFLIMEEMGLTEALAHDKHFSQAGFVALLGSVE